MKAIVLWASVLMATPVMASSSCLERERAAKTWPGKELTRDDDGCWTFYRRGLKHEPSSQPVESAPIKILDVKVVNEPAPAPVTQWSDRWPETVDIETKTRLPDPQEPIVSPRTVALLIAVISALLALFEITFGDKFWMKHTKHDNDGYWT